MTPVGSATSDQLGDTSCDKCRQRCGNYTSAYKTISGTPSPLDTLGLLTVWSKSLTLKHYLGKAAFHSLLRGAQNIRSLGKVVFIVHSSFDRNIIKILLNGPLRSAHLLSQAAASSEIYSRLVKIGQLASIHESIWLPTAPAMPRDPWGDRICPWRMPASPVRKTRNPYGTSGGTSRGGEHLRRALIEVRP